MPLLFPRKKGKVVLTLEQASKNTEVLLCFYDGCGAGAPPDIRGAIRKVRARVVGKPKPVRGCYSNTRTMGITVAPTECEIKVEGSPRLHDFLLPSTLDVRLHDTHLTENIWLEPLGGVANDLSGSEDFGEGFSLVYQVSTRTKLVRAVIKDSKGCIVARGASVPDHLWFQSRSTAIHDFDHRQSGGDNR